MENKEILAAYGIECLERPRDVWRVITPDSVSGMTVVMAQPVVMPRRMDKQDVVGNLACDGRRNIAMTRAFWLVSWHVCEECLDAAPKNSPWERF